MVCYKYHANVKSLSESHGDMALIVSSGIVKTIGQFVLEVKGLQWYEIDDAEDLKYAEENIKLG